MAGILKPLVSIRGAHSVALKSFTLHSRPTMILAQVQYSGVTMLPRIFRMAMSGSLQIAELGRPDHAKFQRRAVMVVYRLGSEGEVLMMSDVENVRSAHELTDGFVPGSTLVGLHTISVGDDGEYFVFVSALQPGFVPIGRLRPARGVIRLQELEDDITLQAWGMDEQPEVGERILSWSLDLAATKWSGEMRFVDDSIV